MTGGQTYMASLPNIELMHSVQAMCNEKSSITLVSCLAYSSALKMHVTYPSITSVDFQWTTSHYIPKYRTVHNYHCENLKSYLIL
jgi:hypothetical protein